MSSLKKYAQIEISASDIRPLDAIVADTAVQQQFDTLIKTAATNQKIAPKAEDFLYFTAIMMHAAERALFDKTGKIRTDHFGKPISAKWAVNDKGSWKWECSDPTLRPYKNNNGDIFPESELKIAYKKWVGKPLCRDHQSNSVDGVRGIILDTYYDEDNKRVIALCALDKKNYPELARKVEAGYLKSVSMGTAVAQSICTECGNIARTEKEYCQCVIGKTAHGEINVGLSPLELSLVVNGADPDAQVRQILLSTENLENTLMKEGADGTLNLFKIASMRRDYEELAARVSELEQSLMNSNDNKIALTRAAQEKSQEDNSENEIISNMRFIKDKMSNISNLIEKIASDSTNTEAVMTQQEKKAYFQGTEEPTPGKPKYPKEEADKIRNTEANPPKTNLGPVDGLPPEDMQTKKMLARALEERKALRRAAVERANEALSQQKQAYINPEGAPLSYKPDPLAEKARKEDKQLQVDPGLTKGPLAYDDKATKEKLNRAKLRARLVKANKDEDTRWDILADDKLVLSATLNELTAGRSALFGVVKSAEFAKQLMQSVKTVGADETAKLYKSALAPAVPPMPEIPAPPAPAGEAAMPEMPAESMPEELPPAEEAGQPASVDDAVNELKDATDKVEQAVEVLKGKTGEEIAPPGATSEEAMNQMLSEVPQEEPARVAALQKIQKVLRAGLLEEFKSLAVDLKASHDELKVIASTVSMPGIDKVNSEFVNQIASTALAEAKEALANYNALRVSFVKFARGTTLITKRAAVLNQMNKLAQQTQAPAKPGAPMQTKPEVKKPEAAKQEKAEDKKPEQAKAETPKKAEERSAARHKLAADALKASDMLNQAHPGGNVTLKGIEGTKENVIETVQSVHDAVESVALKDPKGNDAKTKKAAEELNELIKAGKVNPDELDILVKGGLDSATVAYWKELYGKGDQSSKEFAKDLTSDFSNQKKKADLETQKAMLKRAYDVAYEMQSVKLIPPGAEAIRETVDKVMEWNETGFDSIKRIIATHRQLMTKTASSIPMVGLEKDQTGAAEPQNNDVYTMFSAYFNGKKPGTF